MPSFGLLGPRPSSGGARPPGQQFGALPSLTAAQQALLPALAAKNPELDAQAGAVSLRDAARFGPGADPELVASMGPGLLARARQMGGTEPAIRPGGVNLDPITSPIPEAWNGSPAGGVPDHAPSPPPALAMAPMPPERPLGPAVAMEPVPIGPSGPPPAAAAEPSPEPGSFMGPLPTMAGGGMGPDMFGATADSVGTTLLPAAAGGMGPDMPGASATSVGDLPEKPVDWDKIAQGAEAAAKGAGLLGQRRSGDGIRPASFSGPAAQPFDLAGYMGLLGRRGLRG